MFSILADKLQDVFKDLRGLGKISETNIADALREVRLALLEADVEFSVAKGFIARVKERATGEHVFVHLHEVACVCIPCESRGAGAPGVLSRWDVLSRLRG